jgi:uncharacterized repeat protein (TIGR01451 family)
MKIWRTWVCSALLLLIGLIQVNAQTSNDLEVALNYLEEVQEKWQLSDQDIKDLYISDAYLTKHNGVRHIYVQQAVNGIPIYNAITGLHLTKDQKVYSSASRMIPNAHQKVRPSIFALPPSDAVRKAAVSIGVANATLIAKEVRNEEGQDMTVFAAPNLSASDIQVKKSYFYNGTEIIPVWDLAIDDIRNADYLSIRVDATSGDVVDTYNWTTYCQFDHDHGGSCGENHHAAKPAMKPVEEAMVSGSYRVFPLPAESPSHGSHDLISQPHLPEASPFGWHDVDGDGAADYTITRGNNVHAYPDLTDADQSTGGEPDGGVNLIFDFPFDPDDDPLNSLDAATTNLFYMSNMMHDITYLYGFDEAAGNFQTNNFGNGGRGGDHVLSEAQDGSGTNNANFATPPDGGSGRMQMFLWNSGGEVFQVLEPSTVAGGYESGEADFGPSILTDNVNIEAEIVEAFDDDASNPSFCCKEVINGEDIEGKIALVDRGGCFFDQKVRNCEDAGAIAVIICNFAPGNIGMAGSGTVTEPTIPAIMIGGNDCARIRAFAGRGLVGRIKAPDQGLVNLDGDYDNGIIAHEYGHGISNRLTAGPSAAGCLGNAEQMGEGWSDYYTLTTTVKAGDNGATPRGIGTYAVRQSTDGSGIRPRPYTTDFSINELTYRWVENSGEISQPHGIGTVWCTMLWDLYWALADEYGFDPDPANMDAGNNIANQLVIDGMKLQPCNPGFVDGRDAILRADTINNGAANSCLIWEVFARRGLGYYADQGSSDDRFDGVENFETAPLCQNQLRISKSGPDLIDAGDTITYVIDVANNKAETTQNVVVTDNIPDGCTYLDGSASISPTVNGQVIVFELGDMASLQDDIITYQVVSSPNQGSATLWVDDLEAGEDNWDVTLNDGFTIWYLQDEWANSGENAFYTENQDMDSDQLLYQFDPINLNVENPGLRFFHWFNTAVPGSGSPDAGNVDGGIVEVSTDGQAWTFVGPERMLRNGYTGALPYGTFVLPNLSGFSGDSEGWIDTYVDLGDYKDQDVQVQFRFGTEEGGLTALPPPAGWLVDDIEYLDLFFYNSDVCVTSDNGDNECARLPKKGTLVSPSFGVNTDDLPEEIERVLVYPNPVVDIARVKIDSKTSGQSQVFIVNSNGQVVRSERVQLREGIQRIDLQVGNLSSGTYFIEMHTPSGKFSRKLIKN